MCGFCVLFFPWEKKNSTSPICNKQGLQIRHKGCGGKVLFTSWKLATSFALLGFSPFCEIEKRGLSILVLSSPPEYSILKLSVVVNILVSNMVVNAGVS